MTLPLSESESEDDYDSDELNSLVNTLNQLQHILNDLINGKKYDGSKLDQDKLVHYKLCLVKIMDQKLAKNNMYQNRKDEVYG